MNWTTKEVRDRICVYNICRTGFYTMFLLLSLPLYVCLRLSPLIAPSSCSLRKERTVPWRRWKKTSVWRSVKVIIMGRKNCRQGRKLAKRSKGSEDAHRLRNCLQIHPNSPEHWAHWWIWLSTTRTGEGAQLFMACVMTLWCNYCRSKCVN